MEREEVNLAAIMFTDIVGYTSLTEKDESLALQLLEQHRKIVRPLIRVYNGREVKTMGDAFLVEFPSAAEATRCAIEIQRQLNEFNQSRQERERIRIRIGIHLGDIIHSNNDVYGEAVNVSSRLEGLSASGGICVSRQVYESVRNRLRDYEFLSIGTKQLKNVQNPVDVYRVLLPWNEKSKDFDSTEIQMPRNRVAVLPFVNISADHSDEFFADGLTEELISRLSQAKELRVIARTSAMNYKNNKEKKIREIGHELGAGTLIEGSVRKAGKKVRVTVQVVNASNEEHLWSSTYDRNLDDIFEIQSDIAGKVADTFSSNLAPLIRKQVSEPIEKVEESSDIIAYTYFLQARHLLHSENENSVKQALQLFEKAIESDPSFARAYVGRGECYLYLTGFSHLPFVEGAKMAEAEARKALKLDGSLAEGHVLLSRVSIQLDDFRASEAEARKAVELNPSFADAYLALGHLSMIRGDKNEATRLFETSYRLDPLKEWNVIMLAQAYLYSGREEEAMKLWNSQEHMFPMGCYGSMVEYYVIKNDLQKASETLEKYRIFAGTDSSGVIGLEGMIWALKGQKAKALECVGRIERSMKVGTIAQNSIGLIYYMLGDMDKFFEYMDRAIDIHALPSVMLRHSPLFEKARKDPRFEKLMQREGLRESLAQFP